jgi:plastocyanin domain-containing protein
MEKPKTQIPLVAVVALIVAVSAGAFLLLPKVETNAQTTPASAEGISSNVKVEEYMETIEINAKGGYEPAVTVAKANLPIVIQFNTNGTSDCSAAVTIPSIKYRARLPLTGATTVQLAPQPPGTELQGMCSMGMYGFKIRFAG